MQAIIFSDTEPWHTPVTPKTELFMLATWDHWVLATPMDKIFSTLYSVRRFIYYVKKRTIFAQSKLRISHLSKFQLRLPCISEERTIGLSQRWYDRKDIPLWLEGKSSFKLVLNWFQWSLPATNLSLLPLVISSRVMFCACVHVWEQSN